MPTYDHPLLALLWTVSIFFLWAIAPEYLASDEYAAAR
jgi:hypothetical protein